MSDLAWLDELERLCVEAKQAHSAIRERQRRDPRDLGTQAETEALQRYYDRLNDRAAVLFAATRSKHDLYRALELATVHLEILTGRARACHGETGNHQLLDEAEFFCREARTALARARGEEP